MERESSTEPRGSVDFPELTADIASAYVSNHKVRPEDVGLLISDIRNALARAASPKQPAAERQEPAIPIRRSVTSEFLISLETGQKFRSLKRHLNRLGITPDEYRQKWGLPRDYPMVAPGYAKTRSDLAKARGLGRRPKDQIPTPGPDEAAAVGESNYEAEMPEPQGDA